MMRGDYKGFVVRRAKQAYTAERRNAGMHQPSSYDRWTLVIANGVPVIAVAALTLCRRNVTTIFTRP
jgi:hypothetical protein